MVFSVDSVAGKRYTEIAQATRTVQKTEKRTAEKIKTTENVKVVKNITDESVQFQDNKSDEENSEQVIMDKALEQANAALARNNRYVEREVHEVTHAIMYRVKDSITNEVLFEFPPKKMQDMIAKMWENAGLFVDKEG